MDEQVLDVICEKLIPSLYDEGVCVDRMTDPAKWDVIHCLRFARLSTPPMVAALIFLMLKVTKFWFFWKIEELVYRLRTGWSFQLTKYISYLY